MPPHGMADADKWACRNDAFRKDSGLHSLAVVRLLPVLLLELRACCWLRVGPRGAAWRPAGAMGLDVIRESGARMRVTRSRAAVWSWSRQRRRPARRVGTTRRGRPTCVRAVRPRRARSRRAPRLVRGSCCAASGTLGRASRCFLAAGLDFCPPSALPGAGALRGQPGEPGEAEPRASGLQGAGESAPPLVRAVGCLWV